MKEVSNMRLYRYVKALEPKKYEECEENSEKPEISQKLKTTIRESKLFFSHPASFNDPLECTIPVTIENYDIHSEKYLKYIESVIDKRIGSWADASERRKRIDEAIEYGIPIENCLVTCFTKDGNNQLMWSHYADQNKGVCLCYEIPDKPDEFKRQIKWSYQSSLFINDFKLWFHEEAVTYQIKRPSLHISNTSCSVGEWKVDNGYTLKDAIFTKPKCWEYEHEWRLALILPIGGNVAFAAGIDTSDYYAILPKKWLKEITFGLRLEDEHCKKIKGIFRESGYTNVEFKKAKMAHDEFRIVSKPFLAD